MKALKNRIIGTETKRGRYQKPAVYDDQHPYNSDRWRRLRVAVLSSDPLCACCGSAANEVHHKRPGLDLFFDLGNLLALCTECHDQLQAAQKRGWDCDDIIERMRTDAGR